MYTQTTYKRVATQQQNAEELLHFTEHHATPPGQAITGHLNQLCVPLAKSFRLMRDPPNNELDVKRFAPNQIYQCAA